MAAGWLLGTRTTERSLICGPQPRHQATGTAHAFAMQALAAKVSGFLVGGQQLRASNGTQDKLRCKSRSTYQVRLCAGEPPAAAEPLRSHNARRSSGLSGGRW